MHILLSNFYPKKKKNVNVHEMYIIYISVLQIISFTKENIPDIKN